MLKKVITNALIFLVFLLGLGLICYPTLSNWYNEQVGSYAIQTYQEIVDSTPYELYESLFQEARSYNSTLTAAISSYVSGEAESEAYTDALNVADGMIGSLVIEEIGVSLPIYHGTDESVLQHSIGHLEGSDLPTGQDGEHTVLTGHTGLPSATLLTNLTQLELGDTFMVYVLNEVYTYEVSNILVVEPTELDALAPVEGKNLVTLVTCTPYGINSHRLFVQGELIATEVLTANTTASDSTSTTEASESTLPAWLESAAFVCAKTIAEGLRGFTNALRTALTLWQNAGEIRWLILSVPLLLLVLITSILRTAPKRTAKRDPRADYLAKAKRPKRIKAEKTAKATRHIPKHNPPRTAFVRAAKPKPKHYAPRRF